VGPGAQTVLAVGAVGGDPAADGALGNAEEVGDATLGPALEDALDGQAAALF
jgi:hypothetical protein